MTGEVDQVTPQFDYELSGIVSAAEAIGSLIFLAEMETDPIKRKGLLVSIRKFLRFIMYVASQNPSTHLSPEATDRAMSLSYSLIMLLRTVQQLERITRGEDQEEPK